MFSLEPFLLASLKTMSEFFRQMVLPERRRSRRYPRAVKIKMSNYPRKRRVQAAKNVAPRS